jgi:hypothetical protein
VLGAIGLATGLATLVGGALALRFRRQIPLILGFSAGAVIGVALFDLLPEALALGAKAAAPAVVLGLVGAGFCSYMLLERGMGAAGEGRLSQFGPASLTAHSLLDGLGIGLAFQVAPAAGAVVAAAVLAHDFADGVNLESLRRRRDRPGPQLADRRRLRAAGRHRRHPAGQRRPGTAGPGAGGFRRLLPLHRRRGPGARQPPRLAALLDQPGHPGWHDPHLGGGAPRLRVEPTQGEGDRRPTP